MKKSIILAVLLAFNMSVAGADGGIKKVFLVVLENEDFSAAAKQPFFSQLAAQGTLLTNYSSVAHPSQPNYVALISGSTAGVSGDGSVTLKRQHIGNLLDANNRSWKSYTEAYPGNCRLNGSIGKYARKHQPFISFQDVQSRSGSCAKIVNASQLDQDIAAGTLPDFSLYIPDLNNDGHDTSVKFADQYMAQKFGPLLKDPRFTKDLLFIVTFDEGSLFGSNQVYTVLVGDHVNAGAELTDAFDHYSLLRTIEDTLAIGNLGANDASASPITGFLK